MVKIIASLKRKCCEDEHFDIISNVIFFGFSECANTEQF